MDDFDEVLCRPFTSGSREPPDRQDGFLENAGFYRKHTARDASSLFRVVAEQVLDIQLYHDKVRQDCANYIEKHRKDYEKEMDKNFVYYISNLRKFKTAGSLLELRALAKCYRRNVMLFEPFTSGKWFVQEKEFENSEPIRVFYSTDKHFDSIYTKEDIEIAAKCQGLIFEILYKEVFQLPDVDYAVERMLHDQNEEITKPLENDNSKYQTMSGKIKSFDNPETTSCVLENSMMCHYHNRDNFKEFVDSYNSSFIANQRTFVAADGTIRPRRKVDGFLHDRDKSCVRQLLDEKITPFPYKVAKALDRSIYRNIEFDMWNDNRKELRSKWLEGNPIDEIGIKGSRDGEKCLVYIDPYAGEKKEVFVGGDIWKITGNKKMAPGMGKYATKGGYMDEEKGIMYYYPSYSMGYAEQEWDDDLKKKYVMVDEGYNPLKLNNYTGLQQFQPYPYETVVMPASVNHRGFYKNKRGLMRGGGHNTGGHSHSSSNQDDRSEGNQNKNQAQSTNPVNPEPSDSQYNQQFSAGTPGPNQYYESVPYVQYETQQTPLAQNHMPVQAFPPQTPGWIAQGQPQYYPPAQHATPMPQYHSHFMPQYYTPTPFIPQYATYPSTQIFQPSPMQLSVSTQNPIAVPQAGINVNDSMFLIREREIMPSINFNAKESVDNGGKDLPQDNITLQFYYNLGVRYFQACSHPTGPNTTSGSGSEQYSENLDNSSNTGIKSEIKQEQDNKQNIGNPGQNMSATPVTTKHGTVQHCHTGRHSNHQNNYNNNNQNNNSGGGWGRKPFPNRNNYAKRNEVKFNSNVKNLHKNENIFPKNNNGPANSNSNSSTQTPNANHPTAPAAILPNSPVSPVQPTNVDYPIETPMYQPQPMYPAQVMPYYTENPEQGSGYIQQIPTYITMPMTGPPMQTGPPQTQLIYQPQQVDGNVSNESVEAQYAPNNYQSVVYLQNPQQYPGTAASQNYVWYPQPMPQQVQVQTVPSGPSSGASM